EEDGVFRRAEGRITHITAGLPDLKVRAVLPVGPQEVWVATAKGIVRWDGRAMTTRDLDPKVSGAAATLMTADRESNLWIATGGGLLRVNADGVFALEKGPSSAGVTALFEDRDGSLWIGRTGALERLREAPFLAFGAGQGLPSDHNGPILVAADRRVWFAPLAGGVFWTRNGRME